MVQLSGKDRALNEFSIERVGEPVEQNLVILHGYGAGLGFFYKNFEGLSRARGWQLYALDLLGMGRSTRPPFKMRSKQRQQAIAEAEDWFIDALEEWRLKRKLDKFTLLGHSLGGYMAVAYALKYPGRLNKLILASPVGVPEDPYAVNAELPEPTESTMANEFTQDQDEVVKPSNPRSVGDNNNFLNARSKAAKNGANSDPKKPARKPLPKWLVYLWDANFSPFSLVRWSGPLGPRLVSGWTSRRFSHLPSDEAQALHDYVYSLFRLRGSGEYALAYILAPGAFARSPLIRRIHGVGRQMLDTAAPPPTSTATATKGNCRPQATPPAPPQPTTSLSASAPTSERRERGIPIVLMYGEQDWMDIAGGYAAQAKIEEEKARVLKDASPEEREADRGSAKVIIIKRAGHHLYLDGWEDFNEAVLEELRNVSNTGNGK
jgi:cardiolipin-specific phospholipase